MDDTERDRLIKALEEMDPSDEYHRDEVCCDDCGLSVGYYSAIDRAIQLIRGDIKTWADPKPTKN